MNVNTEGLPQDAKLEKIKKRKARLDFKRKPVQFWNKRKPDVQMKPRLTCTRMKRRRV